MPRARLDLPDALIAQLAAKGMGRASILEHLRKIGHEIPPGAERTVGRRLAEMRGGPKAATTAPGRAPKAVTAAAHAQPVGGTDPGPGQPGPAWHRPVDDDEEGLPGEGLDIEHLPAELLTVASREAARAMVLAVRAKEIVAADKLAGILERFSLRLVEVRPPERIEPVKDPTNIQARRDILERWGALREPYEVAIPVIEAVEEHARALRARLAAQGSGEAGALDAAS